MKQRARKVIKDRQEISMMKNPKKTAAVIVAVPAALAANVLLAAVLASNPIVARVDAADALTAALIRVETTCPASTI